MFVDEATTSFPVLAEVRGFVTWPIQEHFIPALISSGIFKLNLMHTLLTSDFLGTTGYGTKHHTQLMLFQKYVLPQMTSAHYLHLLFLAEQSIARNSQNLLESVLHLEDSPLKLSQVMGQFMPHASLTFLSTCETAMGDENLPDDVIHLGVMLLFAGFCGVVTTMW